MSFGLAAQALDQRRPGAGDGCPSQSWAATCLREYRMACALERWRCWNRLFLSIPKDKEPFNEIIMTCFPHFSPTLFHTAKVPNTHSTQLSCHTSATFSYTVRLDRLVFAEVRYASSYAKSWRWEPNFCVANLYRDQAAEMGE